ncbi:MAG TPA: hypothetical protein PK395_20705, partial [bacterium]|nr:hypothetical protein [bacterium]
MDKRINKFRELAKTLEAKIEGYRYPRIADLRRTRKRATTVANMASEADRLEKVKQVLNGMADAIELNRLPAILEKVTSKVQIEEILACREWDMFRPTIHFRDLYAIIMIADQMSLGDRLDEAVYEMRQTIEHRERPGTGWSFPVTPGEVPVIEKITKEVRIKGHTDGPAPDYDYVLAGCRRAKSLFATGATSEAQFNQIKAAMLQMVNGPSNEVVTARKIRDLEDRLIGLRLPGFFPTPEAVAKQMLKLADLPNLWAKGALILEPSAGKGDLVEAIRNHPQLK